MATHTIFYSWQSDLPNPTNRGFIEDCVQRSLKDLKSDETLQLDPCLDRDTSGVAGSPDIATTIFEKIEAAQVFLADISFIGRAGKRPTPNPNVLIELGYAASCLGWERIVCVFNGAFGDLSDLPFDLRQRRVVTYHLAENDEKKEQRDALRQKLRIAIESILQAPDKLADAAETDFFTSLADELISVIIVGEEIKYRQFDPWFDSARFDLEFSAERLRKFGSTDLARQHSLDATLDDLAEQVDRAATLPMANDTWDDFTSIVAGAVEEAKAMKASHIDAMPLSSDTADDIRTELETTRRQLHKLINRASQLASSGRIKDAQDEASKLGKMILRISHYSHERIWGELATSLREIGRDLHVIETTDYYPSNADSLVARIKTASETLDSILSSVRLHE